VTDPNERQIDIEMQRIYMQRILRDCQASVLIAVDREGGLVSAYMNLSPIERRGMIELLHDSVPRFFAAEDEDNGDED